MDVLNRRFGLRSRLRNALYHAATTPIPKEHLTAEVEPEFHAFVHQLAHELSANPDRLLRDTYTPAERAKDWAALVASTAMRLDSRSRIGHKLLDHHMPHFWSVTNASGKSVARMMTPEALTKALLLNTRMHTTPYVSEIRRTLVLTGGLSNVTKYRAGLAKSLVTRYRARRVFDPCIGWGGRMLGALAAGAEYTGCEPDPATFDGLVGILGDIGQSASIHKVPVEAFIGSLQTASVDMILTSPPYYSLELYTGGDQSVKEGMTWDEWVTQWLRPLVAECLRVVTPEGTSCWSVKNIRIGGRSYPLADVVRTLHEEHGYTCREAVTLRGPGRPGIVKPSEEQTFIYQRSAE
jgi:hypothetical protein